MIQVKDFDREKNMWLFIGDINNLGLKYKSLDFIVSVLMKNS